LRNVLAAGRGLQALAGIAEPTAPRQATKPIRNREAPVTGRCAFRDPAGSLICIQELS
jgi:hypothetical protein